MSDLERFREAFVSNSERSAPGYNCPSPEELYATAQGELSLERRMEVVDHIAECPSCTRDFRIAVEIAENAAPARSWIAPMLAAAAVLALGVSVGLLPAWREVVTRWFPGFGSGQRTELASLMEPRPQPRAACVLRWTPGPPGSTYDVVVRHASAFDDVIAEQYGTTQNVLTISEDDLAGVESGETLNWQVTMRRPDLTVEESPNYQFTIE